MEDQDEETCPCGAPVPVSNESGYCDACCADIREDHGADVEMSR